MEICSGFYPLDLDSLEELRLLIKKPLIPIYCPKEAIEAAIRSRHPYETPEWLVVAAERVGEKYLSWAEANSHTPPF